MYGLKSATVIDFNNLAIMDFIKQIEIKNFRSIYRLDFDELSHVNVFSGLNDVGKSNVIKALNLFFSNRVDWQTDLDFEQDTNTFHANKPRNWKTRKLIAVKLTFEPPRDRYPSLPEKIWVERQWDKDHLTQPRETFGDVSGAISDGRKKSVVTKFLKRCRFFYVPAIRGQAYFRHLVQNLAATLANHPSAELEKASSQVERVISNRSAQLIAKLQTVTNLDFELQLPSSMRTLLESATFRTQGNIPLYFRGDGIQSMTVPAILSYLSRESRDFYFWALEEPENSLEYIKSTELADEIYRLYSHDAQIFISTHSPAFVAMRNNRTSIYRTYKGQARYESTDHEEAVTNVQAVSVRGSGSNEPLLPEELGFFQIAEEFDCKMRKMIQERDAENCRLKEENRLLTKPTLLVEGKSDKKILKEAWKRLYGGHIPFKIVDEEGSDRVKARTLEWIGINENRMCAVLDNDHEGIIAFKRIKKCRRHSVQDNSRDLNKQCILANQVMALTLPIPPFYNRRQHAKNQNLQIEWYFSDACLDKIENVVPDGLYRRDRFVEMQGNSRKVLTVGEARLRPNLEEETVRHEHRIITDSGKEHLANSVTEFDDREFLNFHLLFATVVPHLDPAYLLQLRDHLKNALPL